MALTVCRDCARQVSTSARRCRACGAEYPQTAFYVARTAANGFIIAIGSLFFGVLAWLLLSR